MNFATHWRNLSGTRDEIALVRNATEANSYVANGLDMQPGDEVLMTTRSIPAASSPGTCAQSATASW